MFWLLIAPWARFAGYTSLSCSETWPPFTGENCDEARWFIIWPYTNISAPAADTGDVEPLARFTTSSRLFLGYQLFALRSLLRERDTALSSPIYVKALRVALSNINDESQAHGQPPSGIFSRAQ